MVINKKRRGFHSKKSRAAAHKMASSPIQCIKCWRQYYIKTSSSSLSLSYSKIFLFLKIRDSPHLEMALRPAERQTSIKRISILNSIEIQNQNLLSKGFRKGRQKPRFAKLQAVVKGYFYELKNFICF